MAEQYPVFLTLSENGFPLTEECEGVIMPADYSFECVNDYVHGVDVTYENLEALCLGMASEIDKLRNKLNGRKVDGNNDA